MDIVFAWDVNEGGAQGSQRLVCFFGRVVDRVLMSCTAVEAAEAIEVGVEVEGKGITMTGKKVEGEVAAEEAEAVVEVEEITMMTSTVGEEEITVETGSLGAVLGMTTITVADVVTEAQRTVTMIGTTIAVEDTDLEPTREGTLSQLSVNLRLLLLL